MERVINDVFPIKDHQEYRHYKKSFHTSLRMRSRQADQRAETQLRFADFRMLQA